MATWNIIDTFPRFLTYWSKARHESLNAQIDGWATEYMSRWPRLLEKQIQDYAKQNIDWRQIAKGKVFVFLGDRVAAMKMAHKRLLELCGTVYSKARDVLALESDVTFVIYVGIGCGAGWATRYGGGPACLFGLENIAELGWESCERLLGLIGHELGHLVHMEWRNEWESFAEAEQNPLFQLYSEGFAQTCEHLVLGGDSWHQAQDGEWLLWCREHRQWLAREYLRRVDGAAAVNNFFGSWFDIKGMRQTGCFLGHELIKMLETELSLKEIALLDDVDCTIRALLEQMAA